MENQRQNKIRELAESRLVKVYNRRASKKWEDHGNGYVSVDCLERSEGFGLSVIDKEDEETLLFHRISQEDIYLKQEDTISWKYPEYSTEIALRFEDTEGCSYIWDQICNVLRNSHFDDLNRWEGE